MASAPRTIDIASFIDGNKLRPFNYKLIILSWFVTVFDGFDMQMISFTAPYMREELGLDKFQLGNVFSAALIGAMLGGFALSYLGDRIGRRAVIVWSAFAFAILTAATALARSYEALLVLRFLDGFAIGGMLPLAWALNIEYVPKKMRSSVVTIIMIGYSLGAAIAGPVTVWLAPHYGWEGVFVFGGVGTLFCAVALWFWLPESVRFLASKQREPEMTAKILNKIDPALGATPQDRFILADEAPDQSNFTLGKLFQGDLKWLTLLLWIAYIGSSLAIYFKASWSPIIYEEMQFSRETAAWVSSASGLMGAAFGLLLMRFTDRFGPYAVAVYPAIAFPTLAYIGLVPMSNEAFLILSLVSTSFVGGAHFGMHSIAGIFYNSAIRANGTGWATSIAKIGAIAGPVIGAIILSSGMPIVRSFAILAICPALMVICITGIGLIASRRGKDAPLAKAVPAE